MMRNRYRKNRKSPLMVLLIVLLLVIGFLGLTVFVKTKYTVKNVLVEGSVHYTDDEIKAMVMSGRFSDNSLYLALKYKNKSIDDVPFIETMDVKVVSPDTIKITVYEKALAGYIEFLGQYIYFDKDGVVVEASHVKTKGIPEVLGVTFDHVVMYETLPADDPDIFSKVLDLTLLLSKYGVTADKIYFNPNGETVLYSGDITINLGTNENLDIKIMNLPSILSKLTGMKGTLRMENYSENTDKVSFEPAESGETSSYEESVTQDSDTTGSESTGEE